MTTILKIPRMSQEFLDRLAGRVVRREVWITNTPQNLYQAFGLILMATLDGLSHDEANKKLEDLGAMWETYELALPRGINGLPMFTSGHMVHRLDVEPLRLEVERLDKLIDGNLTTGDTPEARDDDARGSDEVPGGEPEGVAPGSPHDEERPQA